MADERFDAAALATKMYISSSQLNRKLNATTQFTAGVLIREYRMSYAATLVLNDAYSIGEIAYKVGYSCPTNFSRSFKQRFGCSPKDFVIQKNKMRENEWKMREND